MLTSSIHLLTNNLVHNNPVTSNRLHHIDSARTILKENSIATFKLNNSRNPFTRKVIVGTTISKADNAKLLVYDAQGKVVKILTDRFMSEGNHQLFIELSNGPARG